MDSCGADCEVKVVARVPGGGGVFFVSGAGEQWGGGGCEKGCTVGLGAFVSPFFGIHRLSLLGERVCRMKAVHTSARAACGGTRGHSWQGMGRAAGVRGAKMAAAVGACSGGGTDARTTSRRGGHRGGRG